MNIRSKNKMDKTEAERPKLSQSRFLRLKIRNGKQNPANRNSLSPTNEEGDINSPDSRSRMLNPKTINGVSQLNKILLNTTAPKRFNSKGSKKSKEPTASRMETGILGP
ncbi:MAG: hypothetical protein KF860_09670 [Cyclobacteriaceae bacterium]|nr:hypothetical protein [Cyclobacteriaceae bacterium]